MPQPQCNICKHFIALALHMSCAETTSGNCDELVAAFKKNCQKIVSAGVPIDPDTCDVGATLIGRLCAAAGTAAVCAHIDAVASMICHREGACP